MKRILTYINAALFSCLMFTSCSQDADESMPASTEHGPYVQLQLSMPSTDEFPDASRANSFSTGTEGGTFYENHIIGIEDMSLYIFDCTVPAKPAFLGMATDLTFRSFPSSSANPTRGLVEGKLPVSAAGKNVKVVLMVNYANRGYAVTTPALSTAFNDWCKANTFDFGSQPWQESDQKYIPMSGECTIAVQDLSHLAQTNYSHIDLRRSVAKVRIRMRDDCQYTIASVGMVNANRLSYCVPMAAFRVPGTVTDLNPTISQIQPNNAKQIEFYIPEQKPLAKIKLGMRYAGTDQISEVELEFKNYVTGRAYNAERNYLYEYVIFKKPLAALEKLDVRTTVKTWTMHDIGTTYE